MKKGIEIVVKGRVQGVGYRRFVQNAALKYDIHGYVENEMDGSVHISAEGLPENLDLFAAKCHKGPLWARVIELNIKKVEPMNRTSFSVR